jgi:uncharacterized protein
MRFQLAIRIISSAVLVTLLIALAGVILFDKPMPVGSQVDLYWAKTIVTGRREETRLPGIGDCFVKVLQQISGDPTISGDERVVELKGKAEDYARSYGYHDRMEGIPIHDEQGTRDRPYDLTVEFHPEKIAAVLLALGRKPWPAPRSVILVYLAVRFEGNSCILAKDTELGLDQRESFLSAAWQAGLPILLPESAVVDDARLTAEKLSTGSPDELASLARGEKLLVGTIQWNKSMRGWAADWQLYENAKWHHWQIRSVNFDEAFRNAMSGAAQILSDNGEP